MRPEAAAFTDQVRTEVKRDVRVNVIFVINELLEDLPTIADFEKVGQWPLRQAPHLSFGKFGMCQVHGHPGPAVIHPPQMNLGAIPERAAQQCLVVGGQLSANGVRLDP